LELIIIALLDSPEVRSWRCKSRPPEPDQGGEVCNTRRWG
jgi:hypothetical protein